MKLIPQTQAAKAVKSKTQNIYMYLIKKNEADILKLVQQIYKEIPELDLQELLDQTRSSPLFKLQVFLNQVQGNF
jgi:SUMO ligase MMS21 Smc5/6 complex component